MTIKELARRGVSTKSEIARKLGVDEKAVRYHLERQAWSLGRPGGALGWSLGVGPRYAAETKQLVSEISGKSSFRTPISGSK